MLRTKALLILTTLALFFGQQAFGEIHNLGVNAVEEGTTRPRKVRIRRVTSGGIADRMGIQPGDIILRINKHWIGSIAELRAATDDFTVTVIYLRGRSYYRSTAMELAVANPGVPPNIKIEPGVAFTAWEYKVVSFELGRSVESELNDLGEEGWELATVEQANAPENENEARTVRYTFKRRAAPMSRWLLGSKSSAESESNVP